MQERDTGSSEDVMYEEAERVYAEHGKRHGYTGLSYGLAEVLRRLGVDTDDRELSTRLHDPLVSFHSEFEKERVTLPQIAQAVEHTLSRGGAELPYEFRDLARGEVPWTLKTPEPDAKRPIEWAERELRARLKKDRIRRGTPRYRDLVEGRAPQVLEGLTVAYQEEIDHAAHEAQLRLKDLDELRAKTREQAEHAERLRELRGGILEAADEMPSPATEEILEKQSQRWVTALKTLDGAAAALERVGDQDPEALAKGMMATSADLQPFLDAVND